MTFMDAAISAWRRWRGARSRRANLACCERGELDRLARDVGVATEDLVRLSAAAPGAADLLIHRMGMLGLTPAQAIAAGPGVWQDLQRTCCECSDKQRCGRDLETQPDDDGWRRYCPNSQTLQALVRKK